MHLGGSAFSSLPQWQQTDMEQSKDSSTVEDRADGDRAVMRRFSVSLVFQRSMGDKLLSALRVIHVDAHSEEEALGQGIQCAWAEKELTDYSLLLRVVMEFSPTTAQGLR